VFKSIATRTILTAIALSIATPAVPAFAADNELIFGKHDHECQSVQKATRSLKKANYKNVEYQGLAKQECLYVFYADKKRNGEYTSYVLVYDGYDRDIVSREPQKKEEKVEM
jgi:hypothetical protein